MTLIHALKPSSREWRHEFAEMGSTPCVGDYVQLRRDPAWFRITVVCHAPDRLDCSAEVFCVESGLNLDILMDAPDRMLPQSAQA